jgi:signal transduction histidine kinase
VESVSLDSLRQAGNVIVVDALPLRRVSTDLRALLHTCLEIMHGQARASDIKLHVQVDERVPPMLSIDADKIAWAVTTLVGNALRYVRHGSLMTPSGSIDVRATYHSAGPEVTIEVQDDGPGIRPERLRVLFSDGSRQGPGLGLSMVRDVVAAHGGHLEVHSDPDAFLGGTTVRLTLPVS